MNRHGGPSGVARLAAAMLFALTLAGCSLLDNEAPPPRGETAATSPTASSASPSALSATPSTTTLAPTAPPARRHYSAEALDYFSVIALGAEYGDASAAIHKWEADVRIAIHGNPGAADRTTLDDVIADLNALIGPIEVSVVDSLANTNVYFVPQAEFSSIIPEYVAGNIGFCWATWGWDGSMRTNQILISTTDISQTERDHLIREEVTQCLGLLNDSPAYADSMFYLPWSTTTKYSAIDEAVIEMLYLPEVTPGMGAESVMAVLRDA